MKESGGDTTRPIAKKWYYKDEKDSVHGPFALKKMNEFIASGTITSQTRASNDLKTWEHAIRFAELGFDCMIFSADDEYKILGPFSREYIDKSDILDGAPQNGVLYVRVGAVSDVLRKNGQGPTGAELVGRVMAAETALHDSEKRRRELESQLVAKDLGFESERQAFLSQISSLKAEIVRTSALMEDAEENNRKLEVIGEKIARAEARTVDAENETALAVRNAEQTEKHAAELQAKLDSVSKDAASVGKKFEQLSSKYDELAASCKNTEAELKETRRSLSESENLRAAISEASAKHADRLVLMAKRIHAELDRAVGSLSEAGSAAEETEEEGETETVEGEVVPAEQEAPNPKKNIRGNSTSSMEALEARAMHEIMAATGRRPMPSSSVRETRGGFIRWSLRH